MKDNKVVVNKRKINGNGKSRIKPVGKTNAVTPDCISAPENLPIVWQIEKTFQIENIELSIIYVATCFTLSLTLVTLLGLALLNIS